jgi:general secretion pathway protein D
MNHNPRTRRGWQIQALLACLLVVLAAHLAQAQIPQLPQPGATAAPPPLNSPSNLMQVHSIVGAAAKGVAGKLKDMYTGRSDVQVFATNAGHVVVNAPPVVQQEVSRWLADEGLVEPVAPAAAIAPRPLSSQTPQQMVTQSWQLRNLAARDFESRLVKAWGAKLQTSQDQVGDVATFRFPPTHSGTASIVVDRRTNTATVAAPASSVSAWQRLMNILDSRPQSPNERTAIIPVVQSDPSTIQRAVSLLKQLFSAAYPRRKQHIGQFVSMLFQAEAAQPAGGAQPPVPPPPAPIGDTTAQAVPSAGAPSIASMEAIARINNVQIEILDDVIVVRGRREDVDRVLQIIEQIEQQSVQFKPAIEIYYLKHVDSESLTTLITGQIYALAFARQGQVTLVPLQRPNAILLIGRKENLPSMIELISKLDQPAPTDAEFKIFRLQNMSAIDGERTVRGFFVNRPPTDQTYRTGLGTRALVIADYRSNSLLVQAAPRDMIEVTKLIQSLDVPESTITYEVRVFKLRNSIAETLAPVLEDAITATTATTSAITTQGAVQNQTPPRATPPAINLQFLRIGADGQDMIRSGIMANLRIIADARSNTLIVVGPSTAMNLMAALIERLDTLPASEAQIKVFTVRNGDATALAEMLTNLFGQPQGAQQQQTQAGAVTPTGQGESAIVPLRFSVDQRTNSIIASGNAGDLNVIYHILTRLDEGDIRQRITRVFRLRNAPAVDVSNALTNLLTQQLQLIQIAPQLVTPVEQIERQVIVVPEQVTNSVIVSATERYFNEITRIIETLDRRPPMIVIQVVLAEVTLQDNEQFGVEWGLQDALMFDRSNSAAVTSNRFNFNGVAPTLPNDATAASLATAPRVATQSLANFALGRTDPTLGFGGLVLSASSESVNVLLRALEQSSRSQIISRPQVQTLDNLPAFVQVGALVPRIAGITATQTAVIPNVQDINVGLILQVTPRTSPDGTIIMQVYAEKSSVGPLSTAIPVGVSSTGQPILSPQIPRTLAQTTVSARSGQTVVLGGLITKDLEENTRRIPYLADIPVLGRLFRFDTVSNTRTELLIIMTPYLVTSEEQIDWINARESERMSWCVADIVNIHGPVQLGGNPAFNAGPTPLIFPDMDPSAAILPAPPTQPSSTPVPSASLTPGYPAGPLPYLNSTSQVPLAGPPGSAVPAPGATSPPPGLYTPQPATPSYPPGPLPYQDVPQPPRPNVPPPPPPAPGLGPSGYGSSRRPPDVIVPPAPTLAPPSASGAQGPLSPQMIEPAAPPAGTGVAPAGNFSRIMPPIQPPPNMQQSPPTGTIAPANYQQPLMR